MISLAHHARQQTKCAQRRSRALTSFLRRGVIIPAPARTLTVTGSSSGKILAHASVFAIDKRKLFATDSEKFKMNSDRHDFLEDVVGYDAREFWLKLNDAWTEARKASFLLKPEVVKPLSVDRRVWPTVFESMGLEDPIGRIGHLSWSSLQDCRSDVSEAFRKSPLRPYRLLSITAPAPAEIAACKWLGKQVPADPPEPAATWKLLGYDVADEFLLSGLMNVGFDPSVEDVSALRALWAPRLNEWHLFDDVEEARSFTRFTDQRVPEHAPFFVFGLWMVR